MNSRFNAMKKSESLDESLLSFSEIASATPRAPDVASEVVASKHSGQELRVGIVIVNYCSFADVTRCLSSLSSLDFKDYFIVIVDGASPDGSGKKLKSEVERDHIQVVLNSENSGFAASSNLGIELALSKDAHFVWLLNPDTEVSPDSLSSLVKAAVEEPKSLACGSKVLYGASSRPRDSEQEIIWSAGGEVRGLDFRVHMHGCGEDDSGQYEEQRACDYLPGCSMLIRSDAFEKIGLLPEFYFMYFEETDWCAQARSYGASLLYVPESVIWHHTKDEKMQSAMTVYYFNRNELYFRYRVSNWRQKFKVISEAFFIRIPKAVTAYYSSENASGKAVFKAHFLSALHFLVGIKGRRTKSILD